MKAKTEDIQKLTNVQLSKVASLVAGMAFRERKETTRELDVTALEAIAHKSREQLLHFTHHTKRLENHIRHFTSSQSVFKTFLDSLHLSFEEVESKEVCYSKEFEMASQLLNNVTNDIEKADDQIECLKKEIHSISSSLECSKEELNCLKGRLKALETTQHDLQEETSRLKAEKTLLVEKQQNAVESATKSIEPLTTALKLACDKLTTVSTENKAHTESISILGTEIKAIELDEGVKRNALSMILCSLKENEISLKKECDSLLVAESKIESISNQIESISGEITMKTTICEKAKNAIKDLEQMNMLRMNDERERLIAREALHKEDCTTAFILQQSEINLAHSIANVQKELDETKRSVEEDIITNNGFEQKLSAAIDRTEMMASQIGAAQDKINTDIETMELLASALEHSTTKRQSMSEYAQLIDTARSDITALEKSRSEQTVILDNLEKTLITLSEEALNIEDEIQSLQASSAIAKSAMEEQRRLLFENDQIQKEVLILQDQLSEIQAGLTGKFIDYDSKRDQELLKLRSQIEFYENTQRFESGPASRTEYPQKKLRSQVILKANAADDSDSSDFFFGSSTNTLPGFMSRDNSRNQKYKQNSKQHTLSASTNAKVMDSMKKLDTRIGEKLKQPPKRQEMQILSLSDSNASNLLRQRDSSAPTKYELALQRTCDHWFDEEHW